MGELGQLDGIIKSLQLDKIELQQTINKLQNELDHITRQQEQLALDAKKKLELLTVEKKSLELLEDTIDETSAGYSKIIESTRALLEIVASKPKPSNKQ